MHNSPARLAQQTQKLTLRQLITMENPALEHVTEDDVSVIQSPVKRLVASGLARAISARPDVAKRLAGLPADMNLSGAIGLGYDSVVYRDGDSVRKLHLLSLGMNHPAQDRFAHDKDSDHRTLLSGLAEFMIHQSVESTVVPSLTDKRAVYTTQPFIRATPTELFKDEDGYEPNELDGFLAKYPFAKEQLARFIGKSLNLFSREGIVPDVIGAGNLGIDNRRNSLVLIDGYSLPDSHQIGIARTIDQLTALGNRINA